MYGAGTRWAVVVAALLLLRCQGDEDDQALSPDPGDANGAALALAVEGKVFAAVPEVAAETTDGGGTRPTPEPTPTPAVPSQVTLAIFSNCQNGEACLSYGVYEPDTGRKEFVSATCALDTKAEGFEGRCYTFSEFTWSDFCEVAIFVGEEPTTVKIQLEGQDWVKFAEVPYAVEGDSDCVEFEHAPSPPPILE